MLSIYFIFLVELNNIEIKYFDLFIEEKLFIGSFIFNLECSIKKKYKRKV